MGQYNLSKSGADIDTLLTRIDNIFDLIYPVGSIYISVNNVNPSNLFGGVWLQIQDQFLLAAGSDYTAGDTGGSATHTHTTVAGTTGGHQLTVAEMPYHGHQVRFHNAAGTQATAYYYNGATKTNSTAAQAPAITWKGTTFNAAQSGAGDQAGGADPVGGNGAHNNMPPYLVVYMWQRTS